MREWTVLVSISLMSIGCFGPEEPSGREQMQDKNVARQDQGSNDNVVVKSQKAPKPSPTVQPVQPTKVRSSHDGVVRYYDTTDITTPALPIEHLEYYEQEIQSYLDQGSRLEHWKTGRDLTLDDLDWSEIYAVHLSLSLERINEEKDVILHSDSEEYRIVSVAHEPNATIRVSDSRSWKPRYPKVVREELLQQYRLAGIDNAQSAWKQRSINVLADALSYINEQERPYFKDVHFIRDANGMTAANAGLYHFEEKDGVIRQSITIYDNAFSGMHHSFCGSIEAPKSAAHTVMLHEMGHLIANQPIVIFERKLQSTIDEYNALVEQYNRHNDPGLAERLNKINTDIQNMQSNAVRRPGPIIEEFLSKRSFSEGPTEYANTSAQEAFAESYALFKLDREALERLDPALLRWFDSGAYLQHLE